MRPPFCNKGLPVIRVRDECRPRSFFFGPRPECSRERYVRPKKPGPSRLVVPPLRCGRVGHATCCFTMRHALRYFLLLEAYDMSLLQLVNCRSLSEAESALVTDNVLRGLAHLHSKRIIHADLKPANIMLADAGRRWPGSKSLLHSRVSRGRDKAMQQKIAPVTL